MRRITADPQGRAEVRRRAEVLFDQHRTAIVRRTDRLFTWLLTAQWVGAIAVALFISPRVWTGEAGRVLQHVRTALLLGGVLAGLPVALALARPGRASTRQAIAVGQMLMGALLIHL